MKSELPPTIKGRSSRTVFFPIFSSFFVRKTAKAVKQETFPKFGNTVWEYKKLRDKVVLVEGLMSKFPDI